MNPKVASLTTEQQAVLQAVYDHFHERAAWPTFITIDRPLRREHGWDTGAILQGLPESLIVPPQPGRLRPIESDELRLKLLGIQACRGGAEDTDRFVRLLRWLAEREMAHEPQPGSGDEMPRVTSAEISHYLGLSDTDKFALRRLLLMLQLGNWGLGASGSNEDSWYVMLRPDIWRFRDVQTVEDSIEAWEAWASEGRPAIPRANGSAPFTHYHVRVSSKTTPARDRVKLDLSENELESRFLAPRREGRSIVIDGMTIPIEDLAQLRVSQSAQPSTILRSSPAFQANLKAKGPTYATPEDWMIADLCEDVTDLFISEPPGRQAAPPGTVIATPPRPPTPRPYVNKQVVEAIRTKDGPSTFNVTKLLGLIAELNQNYARRNTYASHALLRAILDHVPPIVGCANFREVANNYSWGQTDKRYIKRLADFRDQADDALHRQISAVADVLDFDDMPASVCVDRLLQKCAEHL